MRATRRYRFKTKAALRKIAPFYPRLRKKVCVEVDIFENRSVWEELREKLSSHPNKKYHQERIKQLASININANEFFSLAEVERGICDAVKLLFLFSLKPVLMRAFTAAKTKVKARSQNRDDYITKGEYRFLLKYLR